MSVAAVAGNLGAPRQTLHGILVERTAIMVQKLGKFCSNGPVSGFGCGVRWIGSAPFPCSEAFLAV
jgi:hypothetical protein